MTKFRQLFEDHDIAHEILTHHGYKKVEGGLGIRRYEMKVDPNAEDATDPYYAAQKDLEAAGYVSHKWTIMGQVLRHPDEKTTELHHNVGFGGRMATYISDRKKKVKR